MGIFPLPEPGPDEGVPGGILAGRLPSRPGARAVRPDGAARGCRALAAVSIDASRGDLPARLLCSVVSCLRPPHLLWPLASYMGVFVAMAGMIGEGDGKIARFYAGKRSALVAVSGVILLGGAAHLAWFLPYFSPLQGPYGWKEVAEAARSTRTQLPESAFFLGLGRKYTCTSQLAYQLRLPYDVHGANLIGEKALQYAYWSDPRQLQGRDAVVVVEGEIRAKENLDELQRGFDTVQPAGEILVPVGRSTLYPSPPLKFQLYIGRGYRPPPPPVPGK